MLSGGAVGFSLGLIGGGGSILAVPLLLYVVDIGDPHVAIGTSAFPSPQMLLPTCSVIGVPAMSNGPVP